MKTLTDAWNWYQATKRSLGRMQRLGRIHWDDASLKDASIWLDNQFKEVEASEIVQETTESLKPIDDLAVVVLFSVFESHVRDYLIEQLEPEADNLKDPILKEAAKDAVQGIQEGSFYRRVLEPLKNQARVSVDLVTRVNQVRDYRNWVAHGQRDLPTNNVTPEVAYDRLSEFLADLGIATESEEPESEKRDEEHD
jgi:hypothetical protein